MRVFPSLQEVKDIAAQGTYNRVPVSFEMLSDSCTPIEALKRLQAFSSHCFILESVVGKEWWGRYTFLGFEPALELTYEKGRLTCTGREDKQTYRPDLEIKALLAGYKTPRFDYLPPFTGGLAGYFSYEYLNVSEPKLRIETKNDEGIKDFDLMLFEKVIAFDNHRGKIIFTINIELSTDCATMESNYDVAAKELHRMAAIVTGRLRNTGVKTDSLEDKLSSMQQCGCSSEKGTSLPHGAGRVCSDFSALFSEQDYCSMVEKAKGFITEGDIFQIVLSNRLSADFEGSLLDTYRVLRTLNPSPYMFYFGGTDVEVAGASPETLVKVVDGHVSTYPLAGTRPRGKTAEEDQMLEAELLKDEKELAEHNMLVDLGRNDLGRICEFGSVKVDRLHAIERYSHVMHIASAVSGTLRHDCDALDAIASVLPAGTLSGAPKIRACELIAKLENCKRGIYGGALGYIDFNNNMDMCIAIRFACKKNHKVYVRAGAGVVADSNPKSEYQECLNKAKAVVTALKQASELGELDHADCLAGSDFNQAFVDAAQGTCACKCLESKEV